MVQHGVSAEFCVAFGFLPQSHRTECSSNRQTNTCGESWLNRLRWHQDEATSIHPRQDRGSRQTHPWGSSTCAQETETQNASAGEFPEGTSTRERSVLAGATPVARSTNHSDGGGIGPSMREIWSSPSGWTDRGHHRIASRCLEVDAGDPDASSDPPRRPEEVSVVAPSPGQIESSCSRGICRTSSPIPAHRTSPPWRGSMSSISIGSGTDNRYC